MKLGFSLENIFYLIFFQCGFSLDVKFEFSRLAYSEFLLLSDASNEKNIWSRERFSHLANELLYINKTFHGFSTSGFLVI
jgi:hypothetical protein